MLDFIAYPMGQFLHFIYNVLAFHRYGIAIIILTIFIRLIILPLYIKQYNSMVKMQEIQPQIQEIQKRYKNDKEKLNQELMKVYQENKVNPAGGCLPLLIQMPILFSLYYVISQPLKFMIQVGLDSKVLLPTSAMSKTISSTIQTLFDKVPVGIDRIANLRDLSIINYFTKHPAELSNVADLLKKEDLLNMNFLGLNLGLVPSWDVSKLFGSELSAQYMALLLIPILAAVTTYLSVKYSTPRSNKGSGDQMQASMQNSMSIMMPLMTAFFAFSVPAGLGLYWITGNLIQILQQMFMNRFIIKKKEVVSK